MRIAYIHASSRNGEELKYYIDYLNIKEEDKKYITLESHDDGISPRGDFLSKELDYEAADDGYASLYMPGWVRCNPYEVSGVIYALEEEIDKGKMILKQSLLSSIDKHIQKYQKLRELIQTED